MVQGNRCFEEEMPEDEEGGCTAPPTRGGVYGQSAYFSTEKVFFKTLLCVLGNRCWQMSRVPCSRLLDHRTPVVTCTRDQAVIDALQSEQNLPRVGARAQYCVSAHLRSSQLSGLHVTVCPAVLAADTLDVPGHVVSEHDGRGCAHLQPTGSGEK